MLDLKKFLSVGERIQIEYFDEAGRHNDYKSQIVEIHDNDLVDILIPIHKKRDVYLRKDTVIKIVLTKGEAVYEIKAVIYETLFASIPLMRVKMLTEVHKIQRRNFYRLKVMLDIGIRLVENYDEKKYGVQSTCNMLDISTGGLSFSTRKEFHEKDMLELTLSLNDKKLTVFGKIVRRTFNDNYRAPFSYGVEFFKISGNERNVITKFIYDEQRRLIKKGII
jgi:c-di-GMP-binding flagellar brake protein YcgR